MELFQKWWTAATFVILHGGDIETGICSGQPTEEPKWLEENTEEPHRKAWNEAAGTAGGLLDKAQLIEFLKSKVLAEDTKVAT